MKTNNSQPVVSVICLAYNHEKYIRQALDSILSQKTNFPYEIIVNDDCSTDHTAKILKEYEKAYDNLYVIYHKENQTSKGERIIPKLIDVAQGEFISFCECDDFFCDDYKLQKQIEMLRAHHNCVASIHSAYRVSEDGRKIGYRKPFNTLEIMGTKEIIPCIGRLYALNTLVCYKNAIEDLGDLFYKCTVGDIPIALHLSLKGNFVYSNENMSAYRVGAIGSWTSRMSKDTNAAIKNIDSFIETLNRLNVITNSVFDDEIAERIKSFEFRKYYISKDIREVYRKEFKSYRKELSLKQKLGLWIRYLAGVCLTNSQN